MSELLQFIIVVAFGAFCFGCGVFTAFIVTRNKWRDEMIKRGVKCSEARRIAANIAKLPELKSQPHWR